MAARMRRTVYLVAGEHSGDTRGAELMAALQKRWPEVEFVGLGGPQMRARSGGGVRDWVDDAAVMGFWEVAKRYGWFKARFEETKKDILERDPAAVILVDYPGFNLKLARAVRAEGGGAKVVDYISPQVWAWHKERLIGMADYIDLMLCLFPFEKPLFEAAGVRTVWMGHPLVDQLEGMRIDGGREPGLIGLFPGSREREVGRLFPMMLEAVARLRTGPDGGARPGVPWRYEAAAASESLAGMMRGMVAEAGLSDEEVVIGTGTSQELMQRATAGAVASGTATMEAAYYGLPYCLVYEVTWSTYLLARLLVNVEYIGIANILARREVVHEFVQTEANAENVASFLEFIMTEPERREELRKELLEVSQLLGGGGAAERAADAIGELLEP